MPDNESPPQEMNQSTIRVCLLGSEGSGKTCFLAGLAILGEPNRHCPLTVTPTDQVTASYLDELANTLRRQQWPPPTNMTNVLTIRVGIDSSIVEMVVVDYPGEDFREALRTLKHEQIETLYDHYSKADSILLLFDPLSDLPDVPALREKQIERQMAHLQAIADIWAERSTKKTSETLSHVDVAIVLTKCDTVDSLGTPSQAQVYFRKHASSLDRKIRQNANQVRYFAVSAVGESDSPEGSHVVPAAELNPLGYDLLFQWVGRRHSHRKNRTRRQACYAAITAVLAPVVAYYSYGAYSQSQYLAILNSPHLSTAEKLERTSNASHPDVLQRRGELLQEALNAIEERIEGANSEPALSSIVAELKKFAASRPRSRSSEVNSLLQKADKKREGLLWRLVQDAFEQQAEAFYEHAERFLSAYPTSSHCDEVRQLLAKRRGRDQEKARADIKAIAVHDQSSLLGKSKRIVEFLAKFGDKLADERESDRIERAALLGRQFAEKQTYSVTLKRSGGFNSSRWQGVWLYVGDHLVKKYDSPGASKSVTWSENLLKLQWQSGNPVKIVLRDRSYGDEDVAWMEDRGVVALKILGGMQVLTRFAEGWQDYCDEASIEFEVAEITASDWQAVEDYLTPGDAW